MSGTYTGGSDGGSASDPYDAISYTIPSQQTITIYIKVGGSVNIQGTGGGTRTGVSTLGLSDNTTSITGTVSNTGTMKIDTTQPQSGISKHVTVIAVDPGDVSPVISGPSTVDVATTETVTYTATGGDMDASDWTITSGTTIADVDSYDGGTCVVKLLGGTGTFTLKATNGAGKSGTKTVTVTDSSIPPTVYISSLSAETDDVWCAAGSTATMYLSYSPTNATSTQVAVSSSGRPPSTTFAMSKVSDGRIRVRITPDEDVEGEYSVYYYTTHDDSVRTGTVTLHIQSAHIFVQTIAINGPAECRVGEQNTYTVTVLPADATEKDVSWSVSPSDVAEISSSTGSSATLNFLGVGMCSLTASATDGSGKSSTLVLQVDPAVPCTDILLDGVEEGDDEHDGYLTVMEESVGTIVATLVPDDCSELLEVTTDGDTVVSLEVTADGVEYTVQVTPLSIGTAVLTFTAGQIVKTVEVTVAEFVPVTLNANGGTFPNGMSAVTLECPDRRYVLPDWSVVDRPGRKLSHWLNDGVRGEMGSVQTVGGTWTAQWVTDSRGYDTDHLPHAAVRIYRSLTEWIDATYLQVQGREVVAELAEMRPGMATMTLLNDYETAGHNLLSSDCDLWSSGSDGPIRPGMYVRIDDIQEDGTLEYLMDGFITTIQPDAENVKIEVGDRMTFLGKQGTTLRRNYYGGSNSRDSMFVSAGHDSTGLYADLSELPDGAMVDGTVQWTVYAGATYSSTLDLDLGSGDEHLFTWTFPTPGDRLAGVSMNLGVEAFHAGSWTFNFTVTVTSGSESRTVEITKTGGNGAEFVLEVDLGMMPCGSTASVEVLCDRYPQNGHFALHSSSSDDCTVTVISEDGETLTYNRAVQGSVDVYALEDATGTVNGNRFDVESIGTHSLDDSTLWTPSENRVRVPYVVSGSQSTVDVMEGVAWALGMTPMVNVEALPRASTKVAIFRTGGGYALDYLQKLADIASSDGRMRSFLCRGFTTPVVAIGTRYAKDDTQKVTVHYGGDSASGNHIAFSSFSPSLTLKNRPSLATLRGTISEQGSSESVPLQIAVEDVDSTELRYGVLVETVVADSSIASMGDAGNSAWGALSSSELDQWEGSVTVPDTHPEMLELAGSHAGSGVPIRLTDSRLGLSSYHARVRQISVNYNLCTTKLTISNYSLRYSSGIADTTALAITSADVATGDNSTTLFNSQYARVKTNVDQNLGDGTQVTVKGIKTSGTFDFDSVSVFALPNGRHLVHAVALSSNTGHTEDSEVYGVVAVRIGSNSQLDIRPSVRPDFYAGQTLSVDIDCP